MLKRMEKDMYVNTDNKGGKMYYFKLNAFMTNGARTTGNPCAKKYI